MSEFYPMPSFPTLTVRDLPASCAFYEALGFQTVFVMPGPGGAPALAERARAAGANILREPGDRPWNARDFSLADPDGYALTFTFFPLNRDLDMAAVVANVKRS